jgi:hypothetical protein
MSTKSSIFSTPITIPPVTLAIHEKKSGSANPDTLFEKSPIFTLVSCCNCSFEQYLRPQKTLLTTIFF